MNGSTLKGAKCQVRLCGRPAYRHLSANLLRGVPLSFLLSGRPRVCQVHYFRIYRRALAMIRKEEHT